MTKNETQNYAQYVNKKTIERFSARKSVVFGQNIVAGSRISGLGANLDQIENITAINTPNVENSLMGFGLGMMLNGTDSVFIMKQHDFALLGVDQLTNTVNVAKNYQISASFIVMMVVVDSGYEGPQASLNNLDEFASLSRSPVHFLNSKKNIDRAFESSRNVGFHMMALSQKNMKAPINQDNDFSESFSAGHFIQSNKSSSILVIYFGLDLQYLYQTRDEFLSVGKMPDLFIIARIGSKVQFDDLNLGKYSSIIVIDTSKSEVTYAQKLVSNLRTSFSNVIHVERIYSPAWGIVSQDLPETSPAKILEMWTRSQNGK